MPLLRVPPPLSQGIQLVKQLAKMDDATKQRAEVAAWLKDLDTAEQCYRQMDRPDLAVEMQVGARAGGAGGAGGACEVLAGERGRWKELLLEDS